VIGHADGRRDRVRGFAVTLAGSVRLSGRGRLCPGSEVSGHGTPGQEPFQAGACEGLAAVASAFVEVCGQVGEDVQAGHPGGGGDCPDAGGELCGVLVPGAVGVLPGHDGQAQRPLGRVVILMPTSG
jgi:hypothetical protein